jgi:hypothetical protein
MAYGATSTWKAQFGDEVSPGTNVATSAIWPGPVSDIEDLSPVELINQQIGLLAPTLDSFRPFELAQITVPPTEASAELLPYIFDAGIDTVATSGTYERTYVMPKAADVGIQTYTIEVGNALIPLSVHQMSYGFVRSFTLSAMMNEAWKVSSVWQGQRKDLSYVVGTSGTRGFTASAAVPTGTQRLMSNKGALYIDDAGGSFGGTQVVGKLHAFSITVDTGLRPIFTADGERLYFYTLERIGVPHPTFSISYKMEDSSRVETERTHFTTGALRLFQLVVTGSDATRYLAVAFTGKYTTFGTYTDVDGMTVVTAEGVGGYNSTLDSFLTIVVKNNLAAIP